MSAREADRVRNGIGSAANHVAAYEKLDEYLSVAKVDPRSTDFKCQVQSGNPGDAREFADRLGIRKQLDQAIAAARRLFASLSSLRVYLDWDPEDADEYIVVDAISTGDPDEDTQAYMNYLDEWSAATEWPASQMIRLDLNWPASNVKR